MATASDIMKGGFSAMSAQAINGQVNSAVSAAGSTITDATDLTSSINVVTTVASGAGVQLPAAMVGDEVEILNLGANVLTIYPDAGSSINQVAANTGISLGTNTAIKLRKYTSTKWAGFLSA